MYYHNTFILKHIYFSLQYTAIRPNIVLMYFRKKLYIFFSAGAIAIVSGQLDSCDLYRSIDTFMSALACFFVFRKRRLFDDARVHALKNILTKENTCEIYIYMFPTYGEIFIIWPKIKRRPPVTAAGTATLVVVLMRAKERREADRGSVAVPRWQRSRRIEGAARVCTGPQCVLMPARDDEEEISAKGRRRAQPQWRRRRRNTPRATLLHLEPKSNLPV